MEEKKDIHDIAAKIKDANIHGTGESFIIMASHILMNSGIKERSSFHQIFYFSEIPPSQGKLILEKLDYLISHKEPRIENITSLIEKLSFKFNIPLDEFDQIEYMIKNEFEMNDISEYLREHDEIDNDSFMLGFIACISTCVK